MRKTIGFKANDYTSPRTPRQNMPSVNILQNITKPEEEEVTQVATITIPAKVRKHNFNSSVIKEERSEHAEKNS
jgi:hypothetical protein